MTLMILVIGGSVALIILAALIVARSRRAGTTKLFGRVVHRPRIWASAAACGGISGLLSEARDVMPTSWQRPSLDVLGLLWLAFLVLLFSHMIIQSRAERRNRA